MAIDSKTDDEAADSDICAEPDDGDDMDFHEGDSKYFYSASTLYLAFNRYQFLLAKAPLTTDTTEGLISPPVLIDTPPMGSSHH
ncbi:hypothetical protein RvY_00267 [Ramazzottius varieornatus]|uniref:Uncharacterized protein n=1 Tax=Ramazzottius varieornatus TaxID=947166 RepID=A0A1D1UCN7_RAMVA|nr:hypothetical protein RvY_00267 [Ramazzottius varieornatus]